MHNDRGPTTTVERTLTHRNVFRWSQIWHQWNWNDDSATGRCPIRKTFFSDDSRRRGRLKHTENLIQKMSLYHDDFLRQIDRVEWTWLYMRLIRACMNRYIYVSWFRVEWRKSITYWENMERRKRNEKTKTHSEYWVLSVV